MDSLAIQLERLENAQLVRRTGDEDSSYLFKHALTQDAAYESLLVKKRREIHRRVAQAFERVYPDQLDDHAAVLAAHYAQAGDDAHTVIYATRAGDLAAKISAYTEARIHYMNARAALARLPDNEENRRAQIDTTIKQVTVAWGLDRAEQNLALLFQAEQLAQIMQAREPSLLPRVQNWIARLYSYQNEHRKAAEYYRQVLRTAHESGDQDLMGLASALGGRTYFVQGYFGKAVPLLEQALPYLERIDNWQEWVLAKVALAISLGGQGHYRQGRLHGEQAIQKAVELNDLTSIASARGMTARVEFMAGDLQRMLDETQPLFNQDQAGNPLVQYMILGFSAWAEGRLGRYEMAHATMAAADAIANRFGTRLIFDDWFAAARAEIELNAGHLQPAIRFAQQAVNAALRIDGVFGEGIAQRVWGQALAASNSHADPETEAHFRRSLVRLQEADAVIEAARTHLAWGEWARAHDELDKARTHFEQAAALFEKSEQARELEQVKRLLATLP